MKPKCATSLLTLAIIWWTMLTIPSVVVSTIPSVTLSHTTPSGQRVMVLDNVISLESASALRKYVMRFSHWELHEHDMTKEGNQRNKSHTTCVQHFNFPWIAKLPSTFFEKTCLWKALVHLPVLDSFLPYDVQAEVLRRGDSVKVQCGLDKGGHDEYLWRVFLTPDWQINDYGDLTFYRGDVVEGKDNSEPVVTITPWMGRIVIWDSSLSSLYHPPSMGYIQGLLSVTGKLTTSKDKYSSHLNNQQMLNGTSQPSFPAQYTEGLDLTAKYIRSFNDSKGRTIAVYDNVFSVMDLEHLRHALSTQGEMNYKPYDVQLEEDVDNTQWIKSYDPEKLTASALWKVLRDVMTHVSGNRTSWYPYDVSLNIVRSTDHTRIHQDCDEWEDEYTMVLYMNRDWHPEFYGETVFFEAIPGTSEVARQLYGPNGETEYQPFAAVLPKYGRLAVFQGIIPHSARPPSTVFNGARYTLAVKVSLTRRIALAKRLQETLEDSIDDHCNEQQLLEDLISGNYNQETSFRSEKWLQQRLQDALRKAAEVRQNHKTKMEVSSFTHQN